MTSTDEETRLGKIGLHDEHCYETPFFQDHDEPSKAIQLFGYSLINTSMNVFFSCELLIFSVPHSLFMS